MSTNLYQEAIADAKKIREVAEANAKKAILESVTPKIKEFIENQILEQVEDDADEDNSANEIDVNSDDVPELDETLELDESAIEALASMMNENLTTNNKRIVKKAVQLASSRLSGTEKQQLTNLTKKIKKTSENLNSKGLYNINEETNMPKNSETYYEIDLNMLREAVEDSLPPEEDEPLMADDAAGDSLPKEEVERQILELIQDLDLDIGEDEGDAGLPELDMGELEDNEALEADDQEIDPESLDEVYDIDPNMLRRELRRLKSSINEGDLGLAGLAGETNDYEHHFGGKGSANSKGGDFGGGKPGKDVLAEMKNALRNQRRQNTSLQNKLGKYRSAVNTLREQLEELNLFNAKLLYVNKLLQNKQINESQKRSIVKALDEAQDLREAKVLYTSLTDSFSSTGSKTGSKTLNESMNYGRSSKATRSASSMKASNEVNRWAKLAGLK